MSKPRRTRIRLLATERSELERRVAARTASRLPLDQVVSQRRLRDADDDELAALAASLRDHGQLQAIGVRLREDGTYELIFGQRRLEAARRPGLHDISATVQHVPVQPQANANRQSCFSIAALDCILQRCTQVVVVAVETIDIGSGQQLWLYRTRDCGVPRPVAMFDVRMFLRQIELFGCELPHRFQRADPRGSTNSRGISQPGFR